jgi:restriction system protein
VLAHDPQFSELDAMDPFAFELAVVDLLQVLGFEDVERLGAAGNGARILATEDGERIGVQVRRQSSAVGAGAVRELVDGMKEHDCSRGLVITNSFFSRQAIERAQASGIELWDRRALADFVESEPSRGHQARDKRSAA